MVENMKTSCNLAVWYLYKCDITLDFVLASVVPARYDLILNKKSHTLNFYSFLQKFLLKTKTYKLVVGNCVSSTQLKRQIQRKLSIILSLMSCSIYKLKFL